MPSKTILQNWFPSAVQLRITRDVLYSRMAEVTMGCVCDTGAEGVQDVQATVCSAASGGRGLWGDAGAARRSIQAANHKASPPDRPAAPAQEAQAQCAQQARVRPSLAGQHGGAHRVLMEDNCSSVGL